MEFRVLGPLEVVDGDAKLSLGGPRQRLVLAYLALEANRVVPTDRLIDRIWGDEPPDAARSALFAYISRLKKLLGPNRIQARAPGYALVASTDEVDALRFAELVRQARVEADLRLRARALDEALELWRGDALSDLADNDGLRPALARLDELRLAALEARAETQIALGDHHHTAAELDALVAEHPLRERLWSLLMLALYRSGRQADALAAYQRARVKLADELGIDPSPDLRRLEEQILNQDPALDRSPATVIGGHDKTADVRTSRPVARLAAPVAIIVVVLAIAGAAVWAAWSRPRALPPGEWTIAVDMPLSETDNAVLGHLVANAARMAVDELNARGGIYGSALSVIVYDDYDIAERAEANARTIVEDATTIAMIGPWHSANTFGVIPITNEAGLLQCSPSATHPGLTKPRYGALDLRPAHPAAGNFVRLPPSDDIQSIALAAFAYRDLGARSVLVVDDIDFGGQELADAFATSYDKLGGQTIRRTLNPGASASSILDPLGWESPPQVVFVAAQADRVADVRVAMANGGWLTIPLLSWDALLYDSTVYLQPAGVGPYVDRTTAAIADGTYAAHATVPDVKFSFADAYRARFSTEPDEYAAAGYACVEIIAAALRASADTGPSAADLRGLVRSYVIDPAHRYDTVVGNVSFDANGDLIQQFVTFYRFDASAAGGAGAWVVFKKQDFGPAP